MVNYTLKWTTFFAYFNSIICKQINCQYYELKGVYRHGKVKVLTSGFERFSYGIGNLCVVAGRGHFPGSVHISRTPVLSDHNLGL